MTEDLNRTWFLEDLEYDRWELVEGVTIDVEGFGILESTHGSDIVVNGTVIAKPFGSQDSDNYAGIFFRGGGSTVTIGQSGHIDASQVIAGIRTIEPGGLVTNYGQIDARERGIWGAKGTDVQNYGTITARRAVVMENGNFSVHNAGVIRGSEAAVVGVAGSYSSVTNDADGMIRGDTIGLRFGGVDEGFARVVNDGTISGNGYSITSFQTTLEIVNRGKLIGDVLMGIGADMIDTRGGIVDGVIYGGLGSDTYVIDKARIAIVENPNEGIFDLVRSAVSFRLSDNIEGLELLGRKAINALGNDEANILTGNLGKNRLSGGDGADALYGRQGDDRLIGGEGADVFVFGAQYDKDTISDFEDGVDHLYLPGVTNQQQFNDLKILKAGNDVIIDYGNGDRLIIEDFRKQDLTLDDLLLL